MNLKGTFFGGRVMIQQKQFAEAVFAAVVRVGARETLDARLAEGGAAAREHDVGAFERLAIAVPHGPGDYGCRQEFELEMVERAAVARDPYAVSRYPDRFPFKW